MAKHFQDEQRYTIALLSSILKKVSLSELATMGFREGYLKSVAIINRSNDDINGYIDRLINSNDASAIDIALVILESENVNTEKLKEKRNNIW